MSKVQSTQSLHSSGRPAGEQRQTSDKADPEDESRPSDLGLKVVDLRKSFLAPSGKRIEVLRGVSLSMYAGESVAITGASGSGKSTLLHLIGGLDVPDHGTISLGNENLGCERSRELARLR